MRRIRSDIRGLIMVAIALLACAPSLMAMAPVGPMSLPHQNRDAFDLFPMILPAALHSGEEAAQPAAATAPSLRDSLLQVAGKYAGETYIPYVWGGDAVGSKRACEQCRACIGMRHHLKVSKQPASCQACKQCGMDCSHFVQRIFREAGLGFPYLPTMQLKHLTPAKLRLAKPGDLLLHKNHIVMLLDKTGARSGDFIHVSRLIKRGKVGGVEVVHDTDLEKYRGKVLRILRHIAIDQADKRAPSAKPLVLPPRPKSYDQTRPRIVRAE